MTYAPKVEGYKLVDLRSDFFQNGNFVPTGDPEKAAKVIVDLAKHPQPPMHLVLGSEAIGMLKFADEARATEMEKWMEVSLSTDHDESTNFLDTELGKSFTKK
ncbi:Rossmann-fold NAD(P)-binding domain-containing protein [Pedobacter jejuensis]|uniref:hypothetical protein n=1 Tax=Pedobacter jejuensis TaxID=1268550 RepID=UPI001FC8F6FC|nr:hypothetical protein [Pedobacter jejuensis]